MKTKKKITMEGLAGMVQRGFKETNKHINKIDGCVGDLQKDVAVIKIDINTLKEDFKKILEGLDKVAKHYDDYLKESRARDAEVKRLKRWIEQIAQKVGVKLVD